MKIFCTNKTSIKGLVIFLLGLTLLFTSNMPCHSSRKIEIAFIKEYEKTNEFWNKYTAFMSAAAQNLNIKLTIYDASGNHLKLQSKMQEVLNKRNKPDVILLYNTKQQVSSLIKMVNNAKVPVFLINSGLTPEEKKIMGHPRGKYKYWIGQMVPDDRHAGYILAKELFKTVPANKTHYLLAIKGPSGFNEASDQRVLGLTDALKEHKNIVLTQVVSGNWLKNTAKRKFVMLKQNRYPNISLVWTACDAMALGVAEGTRELGLKPGKDIKVGGIDWIDEAFAGLKQGTVNVSVGGHFTEGAWVIVMLYDYFNGVDFASESLEMRTRMDSATKYNYTVYNQRLSQENWKKINFRKFSKKLNPRIKKYNFSLKALLEATK